MSLFVDLFHVLIMSIFCCSVAPPSSVDSNVTATVVFTRGNSLLSAQSSSKSNPVVEPTSGSNFGSINSHQSSNNNNSNSTKKANPNDSMEMEDDMMDFLTDDSNF